jgi:O-succinylbenzoate synthase
MVAAYLGFKSPEEGTPDELFAQLGAMPGVKIETLKQQVGDG